MAHATNPDAVKAAIKLGAHSVEHAYITDEECISDFVSHGTWYVPTLAISQLSPNLATTEHEKAWAATKNLAPDLVVRADAAADEHRRSFQSALSAGVKMALGSDISPMRDSCLLELGLWVKCGATPWQALTAATKNAAEMCGVGSELGTVGTGQAGRPDSGRRQSAGRHRKPAKAAIGTQRGPHSSRSPRLIEPRILRSSTQETPV